jgi:Fur family ferric uptake transcriptional regulator
MTDLNLVLSNKLKDRGYSVTKPRLTTFEALSDSRQPLTMQELIRRINGKIDRASVYRTIDIFDETGITQKIYSGWKYKIELSDIFQEHHHHFTCTNCGLVIPINSKEIEEIIHELSAKQSFQTTSHQLEIQGLCAKCQ